MAVDHRNRRAIIGKIALLGASAGIVLGLFEAFCFRFTDFPLHLMKPHVPHSFWFFAPVLSFLVFGFLGLLAGLLAAIPRSRSFGMVIVAGFAGLMGAYLGLVLQYTQSASGWYRVLRPYMTPAIVFAEVFAWSLAALWASRKADSPLGFLADVPQRIWSGAVCGTVATLAVAMGISHLPRHLMASASNAGGGARQPNIVLIVFDAARADHFSSYGYVRNTTPNVDQFAKRGVLFENAISSSSWTLPSMASVFTGLSPHQHGAGSDLALGNGPRTLAEILRTGGYETAGFNSNPYYGAAPWGLGRGFDTYTDSLPTMGYSLDASTLGRKFIEPLTEEWFDRSLFNYPNAHQLNNEVYRWFDHRSDRPYFLFINYYDTHDPYEVPPPYDHTFHGHISGSVKHMLHVVTPSRFYIPPDQRQGVIDAYDGALNYVDSQAEELLRFLQRSPDWSNTYVIITSDHGEGFGEHGAYTHGWNLFREVLRVPLIVAGPGIPSGIRVDDIARTRQIFRTALDWAGAKGIGPQHASLSPMWKPNYVPSQPDEAVLSELLDNTALLPAPQGTISLTTREWHFIHNAGQHRDRLYHWLTDPQEQQDVSELPENQTLVEQFRGELLSMVKRSHRPWRDTRYLLALSGPDFSPDVEAKKHAPLVPGRGQGPQMPEDALSQNPENPRPAQPEPDKELLRSLPYGEP